MTNTLPLLALAGAEHRYDGVLALQNLNIQVDKGSFMAVLGPNGAGKSTLAQILSGALRPSKERLSFEGEDVTDRAGRRGLIHRGVSLIPEGRRLFGQLSVQENLLLGGYLQPRVARAQRLAEVYEMMPAAVQNGRDRAAATLSGGEQQMLVIGRALMSNPRAVIIDEPSLGLAPILTDRVYELLAKLAQQGVTVVVFEQLATHAMKFADSIAVIEHGRILHRGSSQDQETSEALRLGYLGHA